MTIQIDWFEMMREMTEDHFLPKCKYCGTRVTPQEEKNGSVVRETIRFPTGEESTNYEHLECVNALTEGYRSGAW